jgi:hypothetical protein
MLGGRTTTATPSFGLMTETGGAPLMPGYRQSELPDLWALRIVGTSRRRPMICAVAFTTRELAELIPKAREAGIPMMESLSSSE